MPKRYIGNNAMRNVSNALVVSDLYGRYDGNERFVRKICR